MFYKKKSSRPEDVIDAVFSLLTPQELEALNSAKEIGLVEELKVIYKNAKPKYTPEESKSIIKPFISFLRSEFKIDTLYSSITNFFNEKLFETGDSNED